MFAQCSHPQRVSVYRPPKADDHRTRKGHVLEWPRRAPRSDGIPHPARRTPPMLVQVQRRIPAASSKSNGSQDLLPSPSRKVPQDAARHKQGTFHPQRRNLPERKPGEPDASVPIRGRYAQGRSAASSVASSRARVLLLSVSLVVHDFTTFDAEDGHVASKAVPARDLALDWGASSYLRIADNPGATSFLDIPCLLGQIRGRRDWFSTVRNLAPGELSWLQLLSTHWERGSSFR